MDRQLHEVSCTSIKTHPNVNTSIRLEAWKLFDPGWVVDNVELPLNRKVKVRSFQFRKSIWAEIMEDKLHSLAAGPISRALEDPAHQWLAQRELPL